MFHSDEYSVGYLGDAAPGTLILPRTKYEAVVLVGGAADCPVAIFLSQHGLYQFFDCAGNRSWKGLLIPNVNVEVDAASVFDAQEYTRRPDRSFDTVSGSEYQQKRAKPSHVEAISSSSPTDSPAAMES
jgi:hypothetical protein